MLNGLSLKLIALKIVYMKIFRSLLVFTVLFSYVSCDAPKLNPLDPNNPNSKLGQLNGFVKTQPAPQQAIAGVKVSWKSDNRTLETDANGFYKLENLPIVDGFLYFEKEGYSKDSIRINWQNRKSIDLGIKALNAIPKLDNLLIYTSVENRYQDDQKYTLFVQASISDVENDIDSVFVSCTAINFNQQLKYNSQTRVFELSYPYGSKNSVPSIDDAIGKNFEIIVKDKVGKNFSVGSSSIKRIIKQEILFELPANGITVGSKPVLKWNRFLPGFNFKYWVQIYTDDIILKLMWDKSNISKDDIELVTEINLPPGNYFWVIWCIDDFQNRTRSKPATFTVQ
ncbi:MAG: carboxypeptidase-like regulatory domain-containing protein [Melioribacter sp.]|nr:carboxypeptidase-like regulatory domain-containing protein [Melioribacter sp.]